MKRILLALSALILLCLASCGRYREEALLGYQTYPMSVRGTLTYEEKAYAVLLQIPEAGEGTVTVTLDGGEVTFSLSEGVMMASVDGIMVPVTDGGYAAERGILAVLRLFSLSPDGFTGAEAKKEDGVSYTCTSYRLPEGEATVYFQKGISRPERIDGVINGRTLSFRFVNE